MFRLSLLACAALAAATASSALGAAVSVGLYVGTGTAPTSAGNYTVALQKLKGEGSIASYTLLQDADVGKVRPGDFTVLLFPGGGGSAEAGGIGSAGASAVQTHVKNGGGYIGTCAGGYLAGNNTCCSQSMPGYCEGAVGCSRSPYALGLVDMGVAEPWDRGHGYVTVTFTDAAVDMLQLPSSYRNSNTSILYWQGPVQSRAYPSTGYTTLATYTSEIASNHPEWTTGQMVHTPAVITTTYGSGRVLISSPHPEETQPMILDLIRGYVLWAGRAI